MTHTGVFHHHQTHAVSHPVGTGSLQAQHTQLRTTHTRATHNISIVQEPNTQHACCKSGTHALQQHRSNTHTVLMATQTDSNIMDLKVSIFSVLPPFSQQAPLSAIPTQVSVPGIPSHQHRHMPSCWGGRRKRRGPTPATACQGRKPVIATAAAATWLSWTRWDGESLDPWFQRWRKRGRGGTP